MSNPKILCMVDLDPYPDVKGPLEAAGEVTYLPPDQETLEREIPGYDALFAHLQTRVDRTVVERGSKLVAVATPTTGTDHIDVDACREHGVEVVCIKTEYDLLETFTATAELAWGLLIACMRELPSAVARAHAGHMDRDLFTGHQLSGKALGILGYGRLGHMVADYGKAFRMRVRACDIKTIDAPGVEQVGFETLLRESDALSLHIHLTRDTQGIIGRKQIARMKPGAVIINTARGALIDEDALVDALESGHLGGFGADTICDEWDERLSEHRLIRYAATHRNAVITPHMGGSTYESNRDARLFTAKKLAAYLTKRMDRRR